MSRMAVGAAALAATATVAVAHGSGGPARPTTYSLAGRQAQEVAVTIRLINAFNAHNLRQALATFAVNASGSDCEYRHVQVVSFGGKREIAAWLRRRFADDDHLGIGRVFNENPEQAVGGLGIDWSSRRSKALRQLGFRRGIVPRVSAKLVFTTGSPPRIARFANGPVGGDPNACRAK
jgi:hypothetical protein